MEQTTQKQNPDSRAELTTGHSPYLIPGAIVAAGLIIAGAVVYTQSLKYSGLSPREAETQVVSPGKSPKAELTITEKDHIRGNVEAPVTIVEYSDFECPFCRTFHPTVQQILADYPDQVRWVYRHFPLDDIHPDARPAAEASECVAEQGGNDNFWQFADGLFDNQSRLGENLYKELVGNLGLNVSQFEECLVSRKYQDRVETDLTEGADLGVRGTPGSFVNGEPVSGAVPYQTLKGAVERALSNL